MIVYFLLILSMDIGTVARETPVLSIAASNGELQMEPIKREILIKPSQNTAYIGQNFDLKCQVTTVRHQLSRQPRTYGGSSGYTKWTKVDGYMSPNVRNVGGNTIR